MRFSLTFDLPEDMMHLPMVRRVSRKMLACFSVPPTDADDIEVILGELATNAIIHARTGHGYRVEVTLAGDLAVVTVSDQGIGFQRDTLPPPGTPRPDADGSKERLGGWGLPMVEMLADKVEFSSNHPHGTIVRTEKRLREMAPASAPLG